MELQVGKKNYYEVLGLEKECTDGDIKQAYKTKLLQDHPDKKGAGNEVTIIQSAYKVLIDKEARREYDEELDRFVKAHGLLVNGEGLDIHNLAEFEEENGVFYRQCPRCGSDSGMKVSEEHLEEGDMDEGGEVIVQCGDCSLWIRVQYEVEEDDGEN